MNSWQNLEIHRTKVVLQTKTNPNPTTTTTEKKSIKNPTHTISKIDSVHVQISQFILPSYVRILAVFLSCPAVQIFPFNF